MISHNRGLEYCIILKHPINYFDLVPDVEKITRNRLHINKKIITIAPTKNTDERLLTSEYYLTNQDKWFHCDAHHFKVDGDPIQLTTDEIYLRKITMEKIWSDNIEDEGWFDVSFFE